MSFYVYRGSGNAKQMVAGPFNDQATADIQAQALSTLDLSAIIQTMNHNGAGNKRTSVSSYVRPHSGIPSPLSQGARAADNDT